MANQSQLTETGYRWKNVANALCVVSGQSYVHRGSALFEGGHHFSVTIMQMWAVLQVNYSIF